MVRSKFLFFFLGAAIIVRFFFFIGGGGDRSCCSLLPSFSFSDIEMDPLDFNRRGRSSFCVYDVDVKDIYCVRYILGRTTRYNIFFRDKRRAYLFNPTWILPPTCISSSSRWWWHVVVLGGGASFVSNGCCCAECHGVKSMVLFGECKKKWKRSENERWPFYFRLPIILQHQRAIHPSSSIYHPKNKSKSLSR